MPTDAERIEIRKKMNTTLEGLSPGERPSAAARGCTGLQSLGSWREVRAVLLYLAFGKELDNGPVIESALSEGKAVFAPVVQDRELEFREVRSLAGPFETGPFGIREPGLDARRWSPLAVPGPALVVVPGLAFTPEGGRMGRGGGFYDRFISRIRLESRAAGEQPPLFIGYGYRFQLHDRLPLRDHDQVLDGVICESAIYLN